MLKMNKNEIYEIIIEDMGNDGEGIGHIVKTKADLRTPDAKRHVNSNVENAEKRAGIAVFVKDTVVGDVARVKIIKVKKNYAYGRLMEIIESSPYRVEAACPKARSCGGCSLMHMSYEKQLSYKWNKVKNCLTRIGGIENAENLMEPICGMKELFHYRNKMQFPVGLDKEGNVQIGFYAGRTHSIIDLEQCVIGHPVNDFIMKHMRKWLTAWQKETGSFIYNEEKHQGLVRHILTRIGFTTGELMVCVVMNGDSLSKAQNNELVSCLQSAVDEYNRSVAEQKQKLQNEIHSQGTHSREATDEVRLASIGINVNKEKTNRILGDKCITLWGEDTITDYIGDIKFRISPLSFYQVNPVQTKVLYDKAVEFAGLTGNEIVWDMYCGIGTISLCLAKQAKKVLGVEIVPQAIEDAKENAKLNGIENVEFFCGKAEEVVPAFYRDEKVGSNPDVVVVDPPRKGCDSALLDTICDMSPKRLVYVSCDPATLARDLKILTEKGFVVEKVGVVDQFVFSTHVESVALLIFCGGEKIKGVQR